MRKIFVISIVASPILWAIQLICYIALFKLMLQVAGEAGYIGNIQNEGFSIDLFLAGLVFHCLLGLAIFYIVNARNTGISTFSGFVSATVCFVRAEIYGGYLSIVIFTLGMSVYYTLFFVLAVTSLIAQIICLFGSYFLAWGPFVWTALCEKRNMVGKQSEIGVVDRRK